MTTISPAGAHRPPNLSASATTLRSLKRQASTTAIEKKDDKPFRRPTEEDSVAKRQKIESPGLVPAFSNPPIADPGSALSNVHRLTRPQDTKRLPLELIDGFFVGSEGVQESQPRSPVAKRSSPLSLPQRPWKHSLLMQTMTEGNLNNSGVRRKNDMQVQTMPYKTESPPDAPRFKTDSKHMKDHLLSVFGLRGRSTETADFAPWMGNHPEDVLNDQTVKQGFIDRMPVSQIETNTARQSLYGLFKHKSGLQTLSALFASVVEERQAHSRISSGSAFKPPPRVTLTEAKRRTWLSDLANPAVPLRKLSRTIPQGIRGQTLLDQCFANNVPIGRALWFAKCVGANEIRTLKRKGTSATFAAGAEIKWLRDWTTNIEQSLENGIEQCGQADWRPRMNYALSLAVRLYSESLLDREHYLDWIVKSISSATPNHSPIWLLLVHLHKTDLIKHRKRGRLLAGSLLEKLFTATERVQSPWAPLVARLKHMVRSMMHTNLSCFVMPQSWRKYKGSVEKCLDLNTAPDRLFLEQLSCRNERLSMAPSLSLTDLRTPRQSVIDILDSASSPFNIRKIAQNCRSASYDTDVLVQVVLEWCSSRFRAGVYRVYLAVRLLQIYQEEHDVHSAATDFLVSQVTEPSCDTFRLRLLVSELVRSRVFSLSRYLQWLTARGGLRRKCLQTSSSVSSLSAEDENGRYGNSSAFDAAQVLLSVPLSTLNPAVKNLRNILLGRAGFAVHHEAKLIQSYKGHIAIQLPRMFNYEADAIGEPFVSDFSGLSWSVRHELGLFLKQHTASSKASSNGSRTKDVGQALPVSAITDVEFCRIRSICEDLGDLSVLADIMKLCTTSNDEKVLASVTDTVNFHLDAFSALEVVEDLHPQLFRAYLAMRTSTALPRQFIVSLISLGSIIPSNLLSVSSLQQDLARGDRSLAVAACSPVSDGMAESLQQAGPAFTEEFEAVLSTGNRMEEQTMTQLFSVLAERLEKGHYQNQAENDEILCALHARLRIYRIAQFDALLAAWLKKLATTTKSRLKHLLPILISTSCVAFEAYVDMLLKALHGKETPTNEASSIYTHLANFLAMIDASQKGTDPVSYKLKLENARHVQKSPDRALDFRIRSQSSNDANRVPLSNELLIYLVLEGQARDRFPPTNAVEIITAVLNNILQLPDDGSHFALPELVKKTTDLSMPFCRLRLKTWAAATSLSSLTAGQEAVVETLFDLASSERDNVWMYYTKALGPEAACQIRSKAEEAFFSLPVLPNPGRTMVLSVTTCVEQASNYLRIISQTAYSIPPTGIQPIIPTLIEKLAILLRGLIAGRLPASNNDSLKQTTGQSTSPSEETAGNLDQLTTYLTLLLQMTSIHRNAFISCPTESLSSPAAPPKQSQQDVVKILVLLVNIASHPSLDGQSEIVSHIFDVAATIVDDASDEARMLCARILKDKMRNERAEYLFGSANNGKVNVSAYEAYQSGLTTDGLQVVKDEKRVGGYRSRNWEMIEGGVEASISLSLFDTRKRGVMEGLPFGYTS